MSAKVMTLKPQYPLAEAASLMRRERIGGIPSSRQQRSQQRAMVGERPHRARLVP
jgi:hypothetical protein